MLDMEEKRAQHEIPVLVTDAHAVHGRETCLARDTRASHGFLLAVARCVADKGQSLNHTVAMRIPVIPAFQRYRLRYGQPGRVVGWSSSATVSMHAQLRLPRHLSKLPELRLLPHTHSSGVDRDKVATISCLGPPGAVLGASYHKRPKLVDLDREGWYTPQGGYGPTSRASRLCWQSAMSKDPSCVISTARGSVPLKAAMISRFGPVFSAAYRAARGGTIMTPFFLHNEELQRPRHR